MGWLNVFKRKTFEDYAIDLKLTQKQLERQAKRCEKQQKQEQLKLKKAIEQHNAEGAKIFAQNSRYLTLFKKRTQLDAVAGKLQSANAVQNISGEFSYLVKDIDKAMAQMDLVKVSQVMSKFECQFEDLDVRGDVLESSMASSVATAAPEDQVQALIQQTADEYNLELDEAMTNVPVRNISSKANVSPVDSLENRLNNLKAP
eukprot:jgi/Galph1/3679/GphlegSOOS_G2361.1